LLHSRAEGCAALADLKYSLAQGVARGDKEDEEMNRGWSRGPLRISLAGLGFASLLGCVGTQMIGLDVGPQPLVLFIDGDPIDEIPESIELTANRDHTLFFQREGYRSQLIIVRTLERDGDDYLSPGRIDLRLKRVAETDPNVKVELDESEEVP
jgi:hypothetical protein